MSRSARPVPADGRPGPPTEPPPQPPPPGQPPPGQPPSPQPLAAPGRPALPQPAAGGRAVPPARARREMAVAIIGCVLGSTMVLFAAAATWVTVRVAAAAGNAGTVAPVTIELGGADLAPATASLGLLGLAGIVAIVATRRSGRILVGVALVAAGVGVAFAAGRVAVDPVPAIRASALFAEVAQPGAGTAALEVSRSASPLISCLGGAVLALAGIAAAARGRSWPALSRRYQARPVTPADTWEAIERGQDPTSSA